ncbi:hypothetical protein DAA51_36580 [Bradyrhizobium sp. WBAH10]|nr:hypothetical protein [Bradyrhizobium sp. WBAH30]MDD1543482.1 hypothetical protein [Bradyrhizobium sp. WBAH41]MDD1557612.1 hypothetical protein [Bradyrhizobium sp. WBAH23]MDD1565025.1 hypothetical protein [Bradyrhizobium sp. WBAH33]MDD1590432.1 hypothetical protein [Bradyrhizobium sp. WBAH42]QCJ78647.1 hypothetical protein DAA51_36580 [Bradyrhizobium sp. WBAH10]QCJ93401.1 hypothetical protein DAA57_36825 [Bradyrhizobium yuanmingense]
MANPQPELLLHRAKFLQDAMRRQRVAEADVRAAIRHQGIGRVEDVDAVVPEADGTFSVTRTLGPSASALAVITAGRLPFCQSLGRRIGTFVGSHGSACEAEYRDFHVGLGTRGPGAMHDMAAGCVRRSAVGARPAGPSVRADPAYAVHFSRHRGDRLDRRRHRARRGYVASKALDGSAVGP